MGDILCKYIYTFRYFFFFSFPIIWWLINLKKCCCFFFCQELSFYIYITNKRKVNVYDNLNAEWGRVVLFSIQQFPCIGENRHCQTLNKCSLSPLPQRNYASIALNSFPNYFVMPNVIAALIMFRGKSEALHLCTYCTADIFWIWPDHNLSLTLT